MARIDYTLGICINVSMISKLILVVVLLLANNQIAKASELVEVTDEVKLKLAQCYMAEADNHPKDWTALSYALLHWHKVRKKNKPGITFTDVITGVCAVHRARRPNRRQRWIRSLVLPKHPAFSTRPKTFPINVSWVVYQNIWRKAISHVEKWASGSLVDPCHGRAILWGTPIDKSNPRYSPTDDPEITGYKIVRLNCSDGLINDFYRSMTRKERKNAN